MSVSDERAPSGSGRGRTARPSLWRTHGKRLRLWLSFQVVATFPLIAGLTGGAPAERLPDLLLYWLLVSLGTTVLFYPWLAHYRAWRGGCATTPRR